MSGTTQQITGFRNGAHRAGQVAMMAGYHWTQSGVPPRALPPPASGVLQETTISSGNHRKAITAAGAGYHFLHAGVPPAAAAVITFQTARFRHGINNAAILAQARGYQFVRPGVPHTTVVPPSHAVITSLLTRQEQPRQPIARRLMPGQGPNVTPPPPTHPVLQGTSVFAQQQQVPRQPIARRLMAGQGPNVTPPVTTRPPGRDYILGRQEMPSHPKPRRV